MRLPYTDPKSADFPTDQESQAIVQRVEARRSPRPLQALDLTLLHSPHVADGWNSFLGAVRTKTSLADDIREVAICRVAVCNRAWYEWGHHAPLAQKGGVSAAGMKILSENYPEGKLKPEGEEGGKSAKEGEEGKEEGEAEGKKEDGGLNAKQWAVVRYTDAMTRDVAVKDEIFEELKKHFSDQEVVEITATVAAYNCVSRFLVALDVGERNSTSGPEIPESH